MIKKFKKLFVFAVFVLFLPLCVKAADYDVIYTCKKNDGTDCLKNENQHYIIAKGETVKLDFEVIGVDVESFSADVNVQNVTLVDSSFEYNSSFWNDPSSDFLNNRIILNGFNGSGDPTFGFSITVGNALSAFVHLDSAKIITSDDDEIELGNKVFSFDVVDGDNGNSGSGASGDTGNNNSGDTNTNDNTNSNTNTNTNTNTNGDTKDSSDSNKSKTDNPVNPKTGVKVSIFGIIFMGIGCVSYLVLRKKNYFNKI